ncbi:MULTISPECIES: crotonobetainyl-CoA--carnitine CoA-transferase [Polymorphospora]|uniref:Crotonobetainyl-CoA--carnitine CoA-transferase n=1 Tax=Polymorphospora lycopeni TaxID=3140240 RepID=A0ABV5CTU8_9ACTN
MAAGSVSRRRLPTAGGAAGVPAEVDLAVVAQTYVDSRTPPGAPGGPALARLADVAVRLDADYCRAVAEYFDRAPMLGLDPRLTELYEGLKAENRRQFRAIVDAGIEVRPWSAPGQPYHGSRELITGVRETGVLYVYLTSSGHGPAAPTGFHPLREPSGVVIDGVELSHNDVFRAVHDIFGHVMFGNSFGPVGEFKATYCHLHMYPAELHPVLFVEHVGQLCWFFYGPHLRDPRGRLPAPTEPGYRSPASRPYAQQKVFPFPQGYIDQFVSMFHYREPA